MSDSNVNTLYLNTPENQKPKDERNISPIAKIFKEEIIQKGFTILNKDNTKPNTKNEIHIIDHILTTKPQHNINTTTIQKHYSDHYLVVTNRMTKVPIHNPRYTQTRAYHLIDYDSLNLHIANDPQLYQILLEHDPNIISQKISETIIHHLDRNAPLRIIQSKNKSDKFISSQTKTLILKRDQTWDEYIQTSCPDTLRQHRHLKKQVNKQIKTDRMEAQKRKNVEAVTSKDKWKNAKTQLGWIKHGAPKMLIKDGQPTSSPQEMADQLNQHYIISAAKTRRSIPKDQGDPMPNFRKLIGNRKLNLSIQPIGRVQLRGIIQSINPSKSSAMDGISMKFLQRIKEPLLDVILHMVNTAIIQSNYPKSLKQTKVLPLLKKDKDPTNVDSYRGINIIPTLAKIIDKTILIQISNHLESTKLIPHQHHGGIPHKSTATALIELIDTWTESLENGQDSIALIMDQSKAYDLVDHAILIKKLEAIGLDEMSIKFMKTYLSDREQTVYIEGKFSYPLHIGPRSVIQGSALSSILYIIFTMDLPLIHEEEMLSISNLQESKNPDSITYVDDNFVHVKQMSNSTLQESLDAAIANIEIYMAQNQLALNKEKTHMVILTKNKTLKDNIKIIAAPENVTHSKIVKILGIDITDDINWKHYLIDGKVSISSQLIKRTNSLKLLKKTTPTETLKILANGIWMSKLLYGAELWSGAPQYIFKHLQHLQLEAARSILGPATKRWSQTHLLKEMNWLSIPQIAQLQSVKMTQRCLMSGRPEVLNFKFTSKMNKIRNTRSNAPFSLGNKPPGVGTTKNTKYQYRPNAYKYYSQLPLILRQIKKPHIFNKRVKRWLKNHDDLPENKSYQIQPDHPT